MGAVMLAIRVTHRAPTDSLGKLTDFAIRSAYVTSGIGTPLAGGAEWHDVHEPVNIDWMFAGIPHPPSPASVPPPDPLLLPAPAPELLELPDRPLLPPVDEPDEPELLELPGPPPPVELPNPPPPASPPDNASPA
jgi:hypothetical protein